MNVTKEELLEELKSLQAQYNNILDKLGQVTTIKVKIEGAMEYVQTQIKKLASTVPDTPSN
jgi:predicted nuclease with TOPRIM domain